MEQKFKVLARKKLRTDMLDEQKFVENCDKYDFNINVYKKSKGANKLLIVDAPFLDELGSSCAKMVKNILVKDLNELFKLKKYKKVFYIGLGNEGITADSLGPKTIKRLFMSNGLNFECETFGISPSVEAKTGVETADVIKALTNEFKPDLVVLFDTFASSKIERLGSCFQFNTKGISVGSGVGNLNKKINKTFLNADCLVVGVPFMIYAQNLIKVLKTNHKNLNNLVLTPNNIDRGIGVCAEILADAFNQVFFPLLGKEEINNIIGC